MLRSLWHLLIVLAFCDAIAGLEYKIRISTSNLYFEKQDGSFKLFFHGIDFNDRVVLNRTIIKPNADYFYRVQYSRQIGTVFGLSFYWTLTSPYPLKYLLNKPSIYLGQVSLVPVYLLEDDLGSKVEKLKKRFCTSPPNLALKHKEVVQLHNCDLIVL